ncbi:hypothetical protein Patl1_11986 [Pistacia atlantica]|uniref:Uncharacterized protein n=1 Tax=Pistacia atlantica TaxID=434234 RepID=A0ACC1A0E9_9ROSI|nr:hypothetical protein Patl1_11986 [Pistacia atlantica]
MELADLLIGLDPKVSFWLNKENESPLYLAAEAGSLKCVKSMLDQNEITEETGDETILSAAARTETGNILECILHKALRFINFRDEEGRTALHLAASVGYLEGVRCLLRDCPFDLVQRENNGGLFPIHMAAIGGHVAVIEELLSLCPDPWEMLSRDDQNILHVAAKIGVSDVVSYVLKNPELRMLLNQRDKDGNTPLHLATMNWHPKIVSVLAKDTGADLKLVNNENRTALDEAEYLMEAMPSLERRLTWSALKVAGAPKDPSQNIPDADKHITPPEKRITNYYMNRVNNLLLVATLVITVTFAAGFTMPGGNNDSDPDKGMATMLGHRAFRIFICCDTIAMYSSIIAAVTLIWAQLGDPYVMKMALTLAGPLLGIALMMMALAFTAGVYVVVNKFTWLGITILVMGLLFLMIMSLIFPLFLPLWSSNSILRRLSWYPFNMLVLLTGS